MGQKVLSGDPPIAINLRRSDRARRISLRVSNLDGRVTLTVPPGVHPDEALSFAQSRRDWIVRALARAPAVVPVVPGIDLPVEGRPRRLCEGDGSRLVIGADRIELPRGRAPGAALAAALKGLARDRTAAAVDRHSGALGRSPARITLRDTRSRWGSCSQAGNLMFSWRLILAPPDVLDYVAAHEVAHLVHMNHSRAFWHAVEGLCPGYAAPRAWLRREGGSLHGWRFCD